jgi:DNA-binding GntR family transcriptional regulator
MQLIDRENHQKLYIQLYEIIKKKIENNEWEVGSRIPTEQELCKMFNVSRAREPLYAKRLYPKV